jgi:hypothetical protein
MVEKIARPCLLHTHLRYEPIPKTIIQSSTTTITCKKNMLNVKFGKKNGKRKQRERSKERFSLVYKRIELCATPQQQHQSVPFYLIVRDTNDGTMDIRFSILFLFSGLSIYSSVQVVK